MNTDTANAVTITLLSVAKVDKPRMSSVAPDTFLAAVEFSDSTKWHVSYGRSVFFGGGVYGIDSDATGDGISGNRMSIGTMRPDGPKWFGVMGFGQTRELTGLRLSAVNRDLRRHVDAARAIVAAEEAQRQAAELLQSTGAAASNTFADVGAKFFDHGKEYLTTVFQNSEQYETDPDAARAAVRRAAEGLEAIRIEAAGAVEAVQFAREALAEAELAVQAAKVEAEALPGRAPVELRKVL